jgi:hypothetical protein
VVAVGLRFIEPVADVDAKLPGVTVTLVAPEVVQLSAALLPAVMLAGLAENDAMVGADAFAVLVTGDVQPTSPPPTRRNSATPQRLTSAKTQLSAFNLFPALDFIESMRNPSVLLAKTGGNASMQAFNQFCKNSCQFLPSRTGQEEDAFNLGPGIPHWQH